MPTGRDTGRGARIGVALWSAAVLLALLVLLLGLNMRRGLNHDEHQFVASGKLIADSGLLPYLDFAYFHVPLLSLVYAGLFTFTDRLLLSARLLSVLCGWLGLALLFLLAYHRLSGSSRRLRLAGATAGALLLAAAPLFTYTSGRAWNHDLPLLLALIAFWIHAQTLLVERAEVFSLPALLGPTLLSGLLVGLASATRLSFALLGPPFLLAVWLTPMATRRQKGLLSLALGAGALAGLAPALFLFWRAPDAFLFGNLGYVRLNTLYYQSELGGHPAMTLAGKLGFLLTIFFRQPGNLALLLTLAAGLWPLRKGRLRSERPVIFGLTVLLSLLLGAFAATPAQTQYFYVLAPFLVLTTLYALAAWPVTSRRLGILLLVGAALLMAGLAKNDYLPGLAVVSDFDQWYPNKVHDRGLLIERLVGRGKTLTLEPLRPQEGNAAIYPEFATGAFGWRVAPLLAADRRAALGLVASDDLTAYLAADPPRAVLAGFDNDDRVAEAPLVAFAETGGFVPVSLPDEGTLWLAPLAEWGGTIRLGAYTLPQSALSPGASFGATFYLQNIRPVEQDLNVLVRAVGADGQELLRQEGWPWGRPTSGWTPLEVWPDGHELAIPATAQPGIYRVELSFYDPATLEALGQVAVVDYLQVAGGTDLRPKPHAALAEFGGQIELRRADLDAASLAPGQELGLELVWQATAPVKGDYTVFVHVVGPDGQLAAQRDRQPLDGFYPTSRWRVAQPIVDYPQVTLPPSTPTGEYRVYLGLYALDSLQRLAVTQSGQPVGDALLLATVQVE